MFESYHKVLNPDSILDVVPATILQALMDGFSFKQHSGIAIFYNQINLNPADFSTLLFLHPGSDGGGPEQNFNPFCKLFREEPACDFRCKKCDKERAVSVFTDTPQDNQVLGNSHRYSCHIGLFDFSYPIRINGKVRAILYAGQKILRDAPTQLKSIHSKIDEWAQRMQWPEHRTQNLKEAATENQTDSADLKVFEERFERFGKMLDAAVNEIYRAKREEARYEAQIEATRFIRDNFSNLPDGWTPQANKILTELERLHNGLPFAIFIKRKRYRMVARSSSIQVQELSLPVWGLTDLALDRPTVIPPDRDLHKQLRIKLFANKAISGISAWRVETTNKQHNGVSCVLVFGGMPQPEHEKLVQTCFQTIIFHAEISSLLSKLKQQQTEFTENTAFFAHSIKLPIHNSFFAMDQLADVDSAEARTGKIDEIQNWLLRASFRAQVLQMVIKQSTKSESDADIVDIADLLDDLRAEFQPNASQRHIEISITSPTDGGSVPGVPSEIRLAFANLLDNAVKYSHSHKDVRMKWVMLSASVLAVEFSNLGVIFTKEDQGRINEIGHRGETHDDRRRFGAGLGLAHAKRLIAKHGGLLEIESRPVEAGGALDSLHRTIIRVILNLQ